MSTPTTSEVPRPAIRSWVEPRNTNGSVIIDPLPADKQQMYELLKQYLNQIDEEAGPLRYRTSMARVAARKTKTLLTIASLYTPMMEENWQRWAHALSHGYPDLAFVYVDAVTTSMERVTSAWLQHPPPEEERSGVGRPPETLRAQETLHEWYEDICVLTGQNMSQACHIIPSSAERNSNLHFWSSLAMFWPPDEVLRFQQHLNTTQGQLQNLMMFEAGIYIAWTKSRFAVKPIPSEDASQLDLEFHYLRNVSQGSLEHTQGNDTTDIIDSRRTPYRKVETGDIIHIKSQDPSEFFLPDAELLMVQYHLQRALRASAAGELLEVLFRGNHPRPDAMTVDVEGDNGNEADQDTLYRPPDPTFCDFLIDSAIDRHIISHDAKPYWKDFLTVAPMVATRTT